MPLQNPYNTLETVLYTDTFKQWADKCNAVIDGIQNTSFVFSDDFAGDYLRADISADIIANWSFSANTTFNNTVTISNPNHNVNISGSGQMVVGKSSTFSKILTVDESSATQSLFKIKKNTVEHTIGYGTGTPTSDGPLICTANWQTPKIINTGETISIGGNEYTWPTTISESAFNTATDKFLIINPDGAGPYEIKYADDQFIIDAATAAALSAATSENLVLPYEQIPVGTHIHVTEEVLTSWPAGSNPGEYAVNPIYPGWRVLDGSTLTYDDNGDTTYKDIIRLIDPTQLGTTGTATLPNRLDRPFYLYLHSTGTTVSGDSYQKLRSAIAHQYKISTTSATEDTTLGEGNWNVNLDIKNRGGWIFQDRDVKSVYSFSASDDYQHGKTTIDLATLDSSRIPSPSNPVGVRIKISVRPGSGGANVNMVYGVGISRTNDPDFSSAVVDTGDSSWNLDPRDDYLGTKWIATVPGGNSNYDNKWDEDEWIDLPLLDYNGDPTTELDVAYFFRSESTNTNRYFSFNIYVAGYWTEDGGGYGTTFANLSRNFLVPPNKYLHFKTQSNDDINDPSLLDTSYNVEYIITDEWNTSLVDIEDPDWTLWTIVDGPSPTAYNGIVTNLKAGSTLIKASADSASNFRVYAGDGIDITPTGPNQVAGSFDIYGTALDGLGVKLATGNNFLDFDSGGLRVAPYGGSKPDGYSVNAIAGTLARRRNDTAGLRIGDPVDDDDATTKAYVDSSIQQSGGGGVLTMTMPLNSDYNSDYTTWSGQFTYDAARLGSNTDRGRQEMEVNLISKDRFIKWSNSDGTGVRVDDSWVNHLKAGLSSGKRPSIFSMTLPLRSWKERNGEIATKSLGDYAQNAKGIVNGKRFKLILDEDDILYLQGRNTSGVLGTTGHNLPNDNTIILSSVDNQNEYMTDDYASGPLPCMIPNGNIYPIISTSASYIQIQKWAFGPAFHSDNDNDVSNPIVVQLKDNTIQDEYFIAPADTRGPWIVAGSNQQGSFGDGTTTSTVWNDPNLGPKVAGPKRNTPGSIGDAWNTLWRNFATDHTSETTQRESFHWHNNAGTHPSEWYIEKIWVFIGTVFAKIRRNDDTLDTDSELWSCGANYDFSLGHTSQDNNNRSLYMLPVHKSSFTTLRNLVIAENSGDPNDDVEVIRTYTNGTDNVDGCFYQVELDGSVEPHGLQDWGEFSIGNTNYVIRLGEWTGWDARTGRGDNPTTSFRVFLTNTTSTTKDSAYNGPSGRPQDSIDGLETSTPFPETGGTQWNVYNRLKGVKELVCSSEDKSFGNTMLALTTEDTIYGWGYNEYGGTGVNLDSDELERARSAVTPGTSWKPIHIISGGENLWDNNNFAWRSNGNAKGRFKQQNFYIREYTSGVDTGRRELYGCGALTNGRLGILPSEVGLNDDYISNTHIRTFRRLSDVSESVTKVWINGQGNGLFYVAEPTDESKPLLKFLGSSRFNDIGITYSQGKDQEWIRTSEPLTIWTFPEDPRNIVEISSSWYSTLVLTKDINNPNIPGRLLNAGVVAHNKVSDDELETEPGGKWNTNTWEYIHDSII